MPEEILVMLKQMVPKAKLGEGYGLTETLSGGGVITPLHRPKHGFIGIPFISTDIKIVDLITGLKEVEPNEEGEIIHKSYVHTQGKPIEVTQRLLKTVSDEMADKIEIKGVATTGSGRNVVGDFLDADLRVTLSGIKVHYDAGYGGGAKAVLPGVAHIDSIEHNHNVLLRETKTAGPVRVFKNEMRLDLIEAARMATTARAERTAALALRRPSDRN